MGLPGLVEPGSSHPSSCSGGRVLLHASLMGWGAFGRSLEAHDVWTVEDISLRFNALEMKAIALAIRQFLPSLSQGLPLIRSDNATAVACVFLQGGTRSPQLSLLAEALLRFAWGRGFTLSSRFVFGVSNVLADALIGPHLVCLTEWTVTHQALHRVWARFGKPLLDLFSTGF